MDMDMDMDTDTVVDVDGPLISYEYDRGVPDLNYIEASCKITRIRHALEKDSRDEFVELINSTSLSNVELEDLLPTIQDDLYYWDSSSCAAAVLAGETQISNASAVFGTSPLHLAAGSRYRMISLLLHTGFSADTRHDSGHFKDILPLCLTLSTRRLECLRCNRNIRTSVVKYIIYVFESPDTSLESVRLLANNTTEVKQEFCNYLKEGMMFEVCDLLLVAKHRLLSSSTGNGEFRSISDMHDFMLDEIVSYINTKRPISTAGSLAELHYKNKLFDMEDTLNLLKIFDKIGDKLATLLRICLKRPSFHSIDRKLAAASLLKDAEVDVDPEYLYEYSTYARTSRGFDLADHIDKKTSFKTYALPGSLNKARGLAALSFADKSCSTSMPDSKCISAPGSVSAISMPEMVPLIRLMRQSFPLLVALKRVL